MTRTTSHGPEVLNFTDLTLRIRYPQNPSTKLPAASEAAPDAARRPTRRPVAPWYCSMERHSQEDLDALQALPASATIVLFTPAVLPGVPTAASSASGSAEAHAYRDPFESFGRAIATHHRRISHMSYLPRQSFTPHHAEIATIADALIVVICGVDLPDDEAADRMMYAQLEFAWQVREMLEDEEAFPDVRPPLFLVQCGDTSSEFWPDTSDFENVINCPGYSVSNALDLANELFRPLTNGHSA